MSIVYFSTSDCYLGELPRYLLAVSKLHLLRLPRLVRVSSSLSIVLRLSEYFFRRKWREPRFASLVWF